MNFQGLVDYDADRHEDDMEEEENKFYLIKTVFQTQTEI